MSTVDLGSVLLAILLLMLGANLLGQLFSRLRQPKVVGEILAGILLGPIVFARLAPELSASLFGTGKGDPKTVVLEFMYHLGLLLLMFISGASVKHVLGKENRAPTAWILGLGTPLPFFIVLFVAPLLPLERFTGTAGSEAAVVLVFAAAAAVTSIPVITKIFYDLNILHTRFASLLLGSAVLEDILLWGVLSVATALASATVTAAGGELTATISSHVAANALFVLLALTVMPVLLRKLTRARANLVAREQPVAWLLTVLLGYVAVAAALEVTVVFAAFLAGFGIMGGMKSTEQARLRAPLAGLNSSAASFFIPIYFAIIGYRLDFSKHFDPVMLVAFLVGTSIVCVLAVGLGAKLAGMSRLDILNIAITLNARGGPGIVMAGVAYDSGIINGSFFTTLVLTAVLTSQLAGFWLDYVIRKDWPLLSGQDLSRRGLEPLVDEAPPQEAEAVFPVPRWNPAETGGDDRALE